MIYSHCSANPRVSCHVTKRFDHHPVWFSSNQASSLYNLHISSSLVFKPKWSTRMPCASLRIRALHLRTRWYWWVRTVVDEFAVPFRCYSDICGVLPSCRSIILRYLEISAGNQDVPIRPSRSHPSGWLPSHDFEWTEKHIGHSIILVFFQLFRLVKEDSSESLEWIESQHVVSDAKDAQDVLRGRCTGFLALNRCASISLCSKNRHPFRVEFFPMMFEGECEEFVSQNWTWLFGKWEGDSMIAYWRNVQTRDDIGSTKGTFNQLSELNWLVLWVRR